VIYTVLQGYFLPKKVCAFYYVLRHGAKIRKRTDSVGKIRVVVRGIFPRQSAEIPCARNRRRTAGRVLRLGGSRAVCRGDISRYYFFEKYATKRLKEKKRGYFTESLQGIFSGRLSFLRVRRGVMPRLFSCYLIFFIQ